MNNIPQYPTPRYSITRYSTRQLLAYFRATCFWRGYYLRMMQNQAGEQSKHRVVARRQYRNLGTLRAKVRATLLDRDRTLCNVMEVLQDAFRSQADKHYDRVAS